MDVQFYEVAELLHPSGRMVAADEAIEVLDHWVDEAWHGKEPGDAGRFAFLVELRDWLVADP